MKIQISVVLWTVICFFILNFILHNLLFKPMLSHLDKRRQKILKAREKQKEDERILADLVLNSQKAAQELRKKAQSEAGKKVSDEQTRVEYFVESLKEDEQCRIECYKSELKEEKNVDLTHVKELTDKLAKLFVSELVKRNNNDSSKNSFFAFHFNFKKAKENRESENGKQKDSVVMNKQFFSEQSEDGIENYVKRFILNVDNQKQSALNVKQLIDSKINQLTTKKEVIEEQTKIRDMLDELIKKEEEKIRECYTDLRKERASLLSKISNGSSALAKVFVLELVSSK